MNEIILYLTHTLKGNSYLIYEKLKNINIIDPDKIKSLNLLYKQFKINWLTILDKNYPIKLFELNYPPFVIFYQGNLDLLNHKNIIYIAGDNVDYNALNFDDLNSIKNDCVLITNNFKNSIEPKIIDYFNQNNGKIIYIAKEGLDTFKINNFNPNNNLILSVYPLFTHPKKDYFKEMNLLISCIADSLLVLNIKEQSSILSLSSYFQDFNKEIYYLCKTPEEHAINKLILNGARVISGFYNLISI
ncbi:hypothetical protein GE118_00925 [Mycoplasma sp. NEAQ87857]|uniref:DNA-processing protein DprA n=1 Tax=Mycoplasma sp. NEAQ87857 TaxID=2683967 RepID=UPI001316EE1E|nr:DNA-processing protein DprA [Mycoplasma sp. NEAQ87857]QGZ97365.1 hypothetical protein GE118_00925 [Mycoplasma sp. NEAQ87857]